MEPSITCKPRSAAATAPPVTAAPPHGALDIAAPETAISSRRERSWSAGTVIADYLRAACTALCSFVQRRIDATFASYRVYPTEYPRFGPAQRAPRRLSHFPLGCRSAPPPRISAGFLRVGVVRRRCERRM